MWCVFGASKKNSTAVKQWSLLTHLWQDYRKSDGDRIKLRIKPCNGKTSACDLSISQPYGVTQAVSRACCGDESTGQVACFIYREPVSWVSRLSLAGVNWQLSRLSLACNSSGRRLASSGFGFLPASPEHRLHSLVAWSAKRKTPALFVNPSIQRQGPCVLCSDTHPSWG